MKELIDQIDLIALPLFFILHHSCIKMKMMIMII